MYKIFKDIYINRLTTVDIFGSIEMEIHLQCPNRPKTKIRGNQATGRMINKHIKIYYAPLEKILLNLNIFQCALFSVWADSCGCQSHRVSDSDRVTVTVAQFNKNFIYDLCAARQKK